MNDLRRRAPATTRNRDPILTAMQRVLPSQGRVLEIASGAGEHAIHFARAMPGLTWRPSDPDPGARESIAAWTASEGLANVEPPLQIDVCAALWGVEDEVFDALVCINMIHISPWEATIGLMQGAARLLTPGGILFLYGPYKRDGRHTAPSNEAFDVSLRARDPAWGVRDLADVEAAARAQGLQLREIVDMPANNLSVVFEKA